MSTPNTIDSSPENEDLPWLACTAAIELDNLRLERQETFAKVTALATRVRAELDDFLQTIVLWESLDALMPDRRERVTTTEQLAAEISIVSSRLQAVADAPQEADISEVNALRDYAVYLSRLAAAKRYDAGHIRHLAA